MQYNSVMMKNGAYKESYLKDFKRAQELPIDKISPEIAPIFPENEFSDPKNYTKISTKPKTLVFDLDETLAYITSKPPQHEYDLQVNV